MLRGESEYNGRRMPRLEQPVRRPGGGPKKRFMDGVEEDTRLVGMKEEDAEDRVRLRQKKDVQGYISLPCRILICWNLFLTTEHRR